MSRADRSADAHPESPCPCGRGPSLSECCGPLLAGQSAPTAERLMRSRYTAFAVGDDKHLLRTWHPSTRPRSVDFDPDQRWTGLEVLHTTGGGFLHSAGTVDFRAHWIAAGVPGSMREHSRFVREHGDWLYLDDRADD
ncbi:YchJ family protein [Rhodococcus sp. CH91]|uniref:YchJ family protein n=1 Tax=Rhodococcus sp. CH91 TaxID=2910256 RepID=UPI001F4BA3F1|nr:YchJ family metal-binding protein [Rhodococcus sp. CH91]